jgi:hypothetical protein
LKPLQVCILTPHFLEVKGLEIKLIRLFNVRV